MMDYYALMAPAQVQFLFATQFFFYPFNHNFQSLGLVNEIQIIRRDGQDRAEIESIQPFIIKSIQQ